MSEVTILSIDAWGNQDDGYDWNNWYKVGSVAVEICDKPHAEILQYLFEEGLITLRGMKECEIEDDQYNLVIQDKNTGEPLFAIAYGELQ